MSPGPLDRGRAQTRPRSSDWLLASRDHGLRKTAAEVDGVLRHERRTRVVALYRRMEPARHCESHAPLRWLWRVLGTRRRLVLSPCSRRIMLVARSAKFVEAPAATGLCVECENRGACARMLLMWGSSCQLGVVCQRRLGMVQHLFGGAACPSQ